MSQTDVSLVINGRYNADAAINAAEAGLKRLLGAQEGLESSGASLNEKLGDLSSILSTVDRAYSTLSNTFTAASAKTSQTEQNIQSLTEKLAQLRQQSEAAGTYMRDALSMGPVPEAIQRSINAAQQAQTRLRGEIGRTTSDLEKQAGAYERQATQLQRLGSYLNAVESGQQDITAAVRQTTEALQAQADAEERLERGRVNRPGSPGYAAPTPGQAQIDEARRAQERANADQQRAYYQQQEELSQAAAQQAEREAAALQRLRDQINPLAAATRQFNEQKRNLEFMREQLSAEEYASALKMLDAQLEQTTRRINGLQGLDSAGRPILFGLRPYQLQNLGYQVNDIITQLGSGTSLSQTLAQQGGQIIQIFDGVGRQVNRVIMLAKEFPITFTAAAASAGAIAYSLYQAYENAQKLANTQGFLAGSGSSNNFASSWVLSQEDAMRRLDVSAKDATTSVQGLITRGFSSSDITRITTVGAEMSRTFGVDVTTAVQDLGKAFRGTSDDMDAFIAKYGTMVNADQRNQIQQAFGRNDYAGAQGIFQNAVTQSAQQGNAAYQAPWWRRAYGWIRNANIDTEALDAGRMRLTDGVNGRESGAEEDQARLAGNRNERAEIAQRRIREDIEQQQAQDPQYLDGQTVERARQLVGDRARSNAERNLQNNPLTVGSLGTPAANEAIDREVRQEVGRYLQERQQREQTATRQQQAQDNAAIGRFSAMVPLLESSGNPNARNPASSAQGLGQFTDSTWVDTIRRHVPEVAEGRSDSQIQALRGSQEVVTRAIQGFAQDVAQALRNARLPINERNLYAGYHFGPAGGVRLLQNPNAPLQDTIGAGAVSANRAITHNADGSQRTGQQLLDELGRRTSQYTGADVGLYRATRAFDQQEAQAGRSLTNIEQRALASGRTTLENARAGQPGNGTAQLDAEVRQRGDDAVNRLTQQLEQLNRNIEGRGGQPRTIPRSVFDQVRSDAESAARINQAGARSDIRWMQPVTEGVNLQRSMMSQRSYDADTNNPAAVSRDNAQLSQITSNLIRVIDQAIAHYSSLRGNPQAMQAEGQTDESLGNNITQLQNYRKNAQQASESTNQFANVVKNAFADDATSGVQQFFTELRNGQGVMDSLRDSFEQFASSFLEQIGEMILKTMILNALGAGGGGSSASGSVGILGSIAGMFNHTGGVVGSNGTMGLVNPLVFAGAKRYHTGGLPGLQPDEVPTILQRGEEVITRNDPRHVMNGGTGSGAGNVHVNVINAVDHGHAIQEGLKTPQGHKAIINFMSKNKSQIRGSMGS